MGSLKSISIEGCEHEHILLLCRDPSGVRMTAANVRQSESMQLLPLLTSATDMKAKQGANRS